MHRRAVSWRWPSAVTAPSQSMQFLELFVQEVSAQGTLWAFGCWLVALLVLAAAPDREGVRPRRRGASFLVLLGVALVPATVLCRSQKMSLADDLALFGSVVSGIGVVVLLGLIVFDVALARLSVGVPRIVQDVLVGVTCLLVIFSTVARAGINLTQIVATSAVLTAVIGLSLQDTLGNLVGGLALQLDRSIQVGDWVRIGEVTGRVAEIHWRYTALETRNWERVVIPNNVLTKAQVNVLGRRTGQPLQWRRWVYFNVDFRYPPSTVIDLVQNAIRDQPILNVAANPPPNCVLMDLCDSYGRYAVRYMLTDLVPDDPTDSVIRTRIYFALSRAAVPLSIPAQAVFVTQESGERSEAKRQSDAAERLRVLAQVELFRDLSTEDLESMSRSLQRSPFARGEVLTRTGSSAHHLYVIRRGRVSVRVGEGDLQTEVAQLTAGNFFGEMSLLTGEPRSATVVAIDDVECYRLDADAFRRVLERHPELANKVAAVLAERRVALLATREVMDEEKKKRLLASNSSDLVDKIRDFFRIA